MPCAGRSGRSPSPRWWNSRWPAAAASCCRRRRRRRCGEIDWLVPHFADEAGKLRHEHPCADHRDAGAAHPGRYLPRQRQAGPPHPALERAAGELPRRPGGGGLPGREHRHRALHPSARRSCRLEHAAAGRRAGCRPSRRRATSSARANTPIGRARRRARNRSARSSPTACSRSSMRASPSWSRPTTGCARRCGWCRASAIRRGMSAC